MIEGRSLRTGIEEQVKVSAPLRNFLRSSSGNIAMMFGLALPALLGSAGVAMDFSMYHMKSTALQAAADASALAGAKELAVATSSDSIITSSALAFLAEELRGKDENAVGIVTVDHKKNTVNVRVSEDWTPSFAHFFGADITPVVASATGTLAGSANICVLTLNPNSNKSLHMDKSARMTATGCGVYSDSTHNIGLTVDQGAALKAEMVCSAGGVKQKGTISPAVITDCPVVADPLASRPAPKVLGCDFNNTVISAGTQILDPGVYCGGLTVTGTAKVTLTAGDYIITGAPLTVSGNATFTGTHVGFYLDGDAALIDFSGPSTISLSGSISPEMAGLLFFEDRNAAVGRKHNIKSSNAQNLTGTIYLPRGYLLVDPNAVVANKSAYTAIIVDRLELTEGPELVLNSNYGATDVPVPAGIRSSSSVVLIN
jgi:Flp pilus assembly protein TadG